MGFGINTFGRPRSARGLSVWPAHNKYLKSLIPVVNVNVVVSFLVILSFVPLAAMPPPAMENKNGKILLNDVAQKRDNNIFILLFTGCNSTQFNLLSFFFVGHC